MQWGNNEENLARIFKISISRAFLQLGGIYVEMVFETAIAVDEMLLNPIRSV